MNASYRLALWLTIPRQGLAIAQLLILINLFIFSSGAHAHLMVAQKGTLNVVGKNVYMVLSVPMSAFDDIVIDNHGRFSLKDLENKQSLIIDSIRKKIHLGDDQENPLDGIMINYSPAHGDGLSDQIVIMAVAQFRSTPKSIPFRIDLFGSGEAEHSYKITATRNGVKGSGNSATIDRLSVDSATAIVTSRLNSTIFFNTPEQNLRNFFALGFEHIVSGPDHVLFLITVLALGVTARRWLLLLTSFTLAHGCTFGLASLGLVMAPGSIIEPLIAASIMLAALAKIARLKLHLWCEVLVVFSCGLIHGLGFSLALGKSSIDANYPIGSIVGFNLGVEAGQLLIAGLVFIVALGWHRWVSFKGADVVPRVAACISLIIGACWLTVRVAAM